MFDYVWSTDFTHLAIVHNLRHWGEIHPFRFSDSSFQHLQMPDLSAPLQKRLALVIKQSIHTSLEANRWQKRRLIATIAKSAQVTDTGNKESDWKEHVLQFTIAFDTGGKPKIEATQFRIEPTP